MLSGAVGSLVCRAGPRSGDAQSESPGAGALLPDAPRHALRGSSVAGGGSTPGTECRLPTGVSELRSVAESFHSAFHWIPHFHISSTFHHSVARNCLAAKVCCFQTFKHSFLNSVWLSKLVDRLFTALVTQVGFVMKQWHTILRGHAGLKCFTIFYSRTPTAIVQWGTIDVAGSVCVSCCDADGCRPVSQQFRTVSGTGLMFDCPSQVLVPAPAALSSLLVPAAAGRLCSVRAQAAAGLSPARLPTPTGQVRTVTHLPRTHSSLQDNTALGRCLPGRT